MPLKINKLINKTFNKYIIDEVVKAFPVYRKHKYSFEYCLKMFKFMLDDVVKWRSLSELSSYKGIGEYHYKYLNSIQINGLLRISFQKHIHKCFKMNILD